MSPRKFLAFDIETVKQFPDNSDWREHRPLGIGCAAAVASDLQQPLTWYTTEPDGSIALQMSEQDAATMVQDLQRYTKQGYTILTWNGMGFDFDVLAEESHLHDLCRTLALNHVDAMFHVFCQLGYPLGLSTVAKGMGTQGKTEGMDGKQATIMWANGQRQPVIDYCAQDVAATLDVAKAIESAGQLKWTSRSGRTQNMRLPRGWSTVQQAMQTPQPDTSWMTQPILRTSFTGWLNHGLNI